MPKNQKIQKIPIQWSQKLTLATFLLITFSKKKCPKFLEILLIQKMQNGPNFQDLKNLKNRFRNEPARAEIRFSLHK